MLLNLWMLSAVLSLWWHWDTFYFVVAQEIYVAVETDCHVYCSSLYSLCRCQNQNLENKKFIWLVGFIVVSLFVNLFYNLDLNIPSEFQIVFGGKFSIQYLHCSCGHPFIDHVFYSRLINKYLQEFVNWNWKFDCHCPKSYKLT